MASEILGVEGSNVASALPTASAYCQHRLGEKNLAKTGNCW